MRWLKIGKEISQEGTTITYELDGDTRYTIESRKRHIPHSGGKPGTWECTTYFVMLDGQELVEKFSLRAAKEFAVAWKHWTEG